MTLYVAHRGMNRQALENTIPAFELALAQADGVELDVQLARCGTPVVFHDDQLKGIFGVPGTVEDYTAEELAGFAAAPTEDYNAPKGWTPSVEERIPTLDTVLALLGDEFFVNVEIKAPRLRRKTPTAAVAELLTTRKGNYLVSSFNPVELARFRRLCPHIEIGFLFDHRSNLVLRQGWPAPVLGLGGMSAVHPNWKLVSPDLVERAHARDWRVNVWTVNDPERAAWLARDGVDALISDVPDRIRPK